MNLRLDTKILKLWPKLVDHYKGNTGDADGALLGIDNELNLSYTLDEDSEQQILEFESVNGQNNIDF